jgi:hypothetical protein
MQKAMGNHCIKVLTDIPSMSSSWELLQSNPWIDDQKKKLFTVNLCITYFIALGRLLLATVTGFNIWLQ